MKNIKLTIEYDGTNFFGWQIQPQKRTVQGALKDILIKITGDADIDLRGCGRTDSGVHALAFIANFYTHCDIPADKYSYILNPLLPPDIVIKKSCEAADSFHSRFDCIGKTYLYLFNNEKFRSAIFANRTAHVYKHLDTVLMNKAASYFNGEHDFVSYMASGSYVKDAVRTVYSASCYKSSGFICFEITGSGFLYNMVRIMAGTLVNAGMGKITPEQVADIINLKNRKIAGKTMPACGLYFKEAFYETDSLYKYLNSNAQNTEYGGKKA